MVYIVKKTHIKLFTSLAILAAVALTFSSQLALAGKKECPQILAELDSLHAADEISSVLAERHKLIEYLYADEKVNLAVQSPLDIMNAAQRMLALIYSQGKSKAKLFLSGETVEYFPFFSDGLPLTKGYRIVGNERAIADFVNNVKSQASGDRAGSSVVLLVGSHGTGKSETLKLLGLGAEALTSRKDKSFALHTFSWVGLEKFPSLHKFFNMVEVDGRNVIPELDAPLGDSPITLFPPEVQQLVIKKAAQHAASMIDGMAPSPFLKPDPVSEFIRNEIVQHYSRERGHVLSAKEIVEVLNDHVVVKRQLLSQSQGKMPLIDAQGNDLDLQGLFVSPNPVVRFASGVGPAHVMAWYYNGKVPKSHGAALLFDEIYRNPEEMLNLLLGAFESRTIALGGAPSLPFDSLMIAATNTANLEKVTSDKAGHASVDRFRKTPMRWSVMPSDVARVLLNGKLSGLMQQRLDNLDAPFMPGRIDDLFPRQEYKQKFVTPDHKYRVWFGQNAKRIEVAPHALTLLAEITAASRMETDPKAAAAVSNAKIVVSNIFKNPIDRLRLLEGERSEVKQSEIQELIEVTTLLREGEKGISARDAARWFTDALNVAATEENNFTLTPRIVLETFHELLIEGTITAPSNKVRLEWLALANEIRNQMLIPRIESDVRMALSQDDQEVKTAYFDVIDELIALHRDSEATTYTSTRTQQEHGIDKTRLAFLQSEYKTRTGKELNGAQIAIFHMQQMSQGEVGSTPDEDLMTVLTQYFASLHAKLAAFSAFIDPNQVADSESLTNRQMSFVSSLEKMGYNPTAVREALIMLHAHQGNSQSAPDDGTP